MTADNGGRDRAAPTGAAPRGLFVATPCYGGLVGHLYLRSMLALQARCIAEGVAFEAATLGGDALISRARSTLAQAFLDSAAGHLLFVDADIGFEPEAALRLLHSGRDVVGGLYPRRGGAVADRGWEVAWPPGGPVPDGGFALAEQVGLGFTLIARPVLEAIRAATPALAYATLHDATPGRRRPGHGWFEPLADPATGAVLADDAAFCRRAAACGIAVWADLACRLSHTGPATLDGDYAAKLGMQPREPESP